MDKREFVTTKSQGKQLFGILHLPKEVEDPPPIVVFMHGFASHKVGTNRCYVRLAERFAREGYASLRFDFSGAGDSEGSFSSMTFEDLVADAKAMLTFAQTLDRVDTSKIAIFGSSLGGALSVLAASSFQDLSALILWSPVASGQLWVRDFLARNPEAMKQDPHTVLSSYRGMPVSTEFRQQFAKMSAAEKMETLSHVPTLHMHGENDDTVSLLHQQVYKMHCTNHADRTKFIAYPETDHRLGYAKVFPDVIEESVTWLNQHLGTKESYAEELL